MVLRADAEGAPSLLLGEEHASSPRPQIAQQNRTAGEPEGRGGIVLRTPPRRGRDLAKRGEAQGARGQGNTCPDFYIIQHLYSSSYPDFYITQLMITYNPSGVA